LALLVMLVLALPARAQDLETRRTKLDDLAVQIDRCQVELEFSSPSVAVVFCQPSL